MDSHAWRLLDRLLLGLYDTQGYAEQLLTWECARCGVRIWADGMVHRETGHICPVAWEANTRKERSRKDAWGAAWNTIERSQRQAAIVAARQRLDVQRRLGVA
jgi:hypothetical protein